MFFISLNTFHNPQPIFDEEIFFLTISVVKQLKSSKIIHWSPWRIWRPWTSRNVRILSLWSQIAGNFWSGPCRSFWYFSLHTFCKFFLKPRDCIDKLRSSRDCSCSLCSYGCAGLNGWRCKWRSSQGWKCWLLITWCWGLCVVLSCRFCVKLVVKSDKKGNFETTTTPHSVGM